VLVNPSLSKGASTVPVTTTAGAFHNYANDEISRQFKERMNFDKNVM